MVPTLVPRRSALGWVNPHHPPTPRRSVVSYTVFGISFTESEYVGSPNGDAT